ncbi:choice-of-anchor A domain-containing protein [Paraoerskovia marina]|uniref:Choice-of-anchor A domain-containing protein n=1 Tax=Paraoerskovia marina TaxID=545619 RepID=A0A1H1NQC8_9CELL|nr:DUF5979 domain-containing protein [Paraoerskovia marina]SDS01010.1 choice-of-anchor A domain-containing protein [Paraoerskovia marina]
MNRSRTVRLRARWASASALALVAATSTVATAMPATAAQTSPVASTLSTAPETFSSAAYCPEVPPDIGNGGPAGFDSNVNVYVGGDWYTTEGAAETEGVVVVNGNATFDRDPDGLFNIGVVGVGSQVPPPPGSTMLHVGGDLTTVGTNVIHVGIGHHTVGGGVNVGGTITPTPADAPWDTGNVQTAGALVQEGMGHDAALVPFESFGSTALDTSTAYAALEPTGTVSSEWGTTTLTGTGADTTDRQVFEIDLNKTPEALGTASTAATIAFVDVNPDATIVINVIGPDSGTTTVNVNSFFGDGAPLDFSSIGQWATDTLWNFENADTLNLEGSAQFVGSVVVPSTSGTVTTSMPGLNGRLYVGGDLVQAGSGTEIHAFPFDDGTGWGCTGGITLTKVVEDPSGTVPADTVFTGTWECTLDGEVSASGTWELTDGESVTPDVEIPVGSTCAVEENTAPPVDGGSWEAPVVTPEQPFVVTDGTTAVGVVVTNTFVPTTVEESTGFSITKTVDDEYGSIAADKTFTGTWACELNDAPVGDGEWTLAAGESVTVADGLPLSATCTVEENFTDGTADGTWAEPVISPESVTLSDTTELTTVTVANTFEQNLGQLSVLKIVDDADSGLVPADTTYSGDYLCTFDGTEIAAGTWEVDGSGTAVVATDLPYGTECELTEDAAPAVEGGTWIAPTIVGSPVVIGESGSDVARVSVTNTFVETPAPVVGGFEITKTLNDEGGVVPVGTEFTGTFECTADGGVVDSGVWSVAAGETVTVAEDLPVGAECTVEEDAPAEVEGGTWDAPAISGSPLTVTDGTDGLANVTVTNTFTGTTPTPTPTPEPVTGHFAITKVLDDQTGLLTEDLTYTGDWECVLDGSSVGSGTWELQAGETVTVSEELPVGAECAVTEDALSPSAWGEWREPTVSAPVTIVDTEVLPVVTVTNTLTPFEPEVLPTTVPSPEPTTGPTTVPSPEPTTDVTEGPGGLAVTGSAVIGTLAVAALLVLIGVGIVVLRRRHS